LIREEIDPKGFDGSKASPFSYQLLKGELTQSGQGLHNLPLTVTEETGGASAEVGVLKKTWPLNLDSCWTVEGKKN
jgi:hypothetical protein